MLQWHHFVFGKKKYEKKNIHNFSLTIIQCYDIDWVIMNLQEAAEVETGLELWITICAFY